MNLPASLALGIASVLLVIAVSAYNPQIASLLYIVLFARALSVLALQYFLYSKAMALTSEGKFDLALAKYKGALKWGRPFFWVGLLNSKFIIYNIATAYGRWGHFEESLQWLDKLNPKKLPKVLCQSYYSLYAFNLLHLKQDLDHAEEYLNLATEAGKMPFVLLGFCYLCLLKNDLEGAANYIDQYLNNPNRQKEFYQKGAVRLKIDKVYVSLLENFYLGLYYQVVGDTEKAKEHLFVPAMSPYDNFLKREAYRIYNSLA